MNDKRPLLSEGSNSLTHPPIVGLLPDDIKEALVKANKDNKGSFSDYIRQIEDIFGIDPLPGGNNLTTNQKYFIGGFIEGEGSINVSLKKLATSKFGVIVDPEFSLTQHANGVSVLHKALCAFKTGRLRYKAGSNATLVLVIDNRQSLLEKVVPFYEKFVKQNSTPTKIKRLANFKTLLQLLDAKAHHSPDLLIQQILPLWEEMRMQTQKGQSFASIDDVIKFINAFIIK